MRKVLIVDDEAAILENLRSFLKRSGFETEQAENGIEGLAVVDTFAPDIIILDVMMPKLDGRQMLRILRERNNWTPVILLTQVGDATDRAMALTEGADDYLNKPYDPHELVARIQSILRRAQRGQESLASADLLSAGQIIFDRKSRIVKLNGRKINLTPRALHLLEYLLLHPNEPISRDRMLNAVWGWDFVTGTRSVDARIVEIRKALQGDGQTNYIETVSGEGYRFVAEVRKVTQ
ncbi:MAG: response regulator transcription factor [Arenicella sp.]